MNNIVKRSGSFFGLWNHVRHSIVDAGKHPITWCRNNEVLERSLAISRAFHFTFFAESHSEDEAKKKAIACDGFSYRVGVAGFEPATLVPNQVR